jgi:hypothetical protein
MDNTPAKVLTKRATVLKIRNKVLAIEKVFKNSLAYQIVAKQKDQKQKIKIRILNGEEERRKKKTSNLEKIRNKLSLRTGVGEGAANFLTNTLMGFLFTAIVPALPKLSGIINALKPAAWFVSALTNLFLNTIGGFIETGYKLHDTIKGTSENIKKIPIKKEFDDFQTTLSKSLGSVVDIVYDITGSKPPTQQAKEQTKKPVKGAAVGGPISYTPPSRKLKKSQELNIPRKQTIPETKIGKDVGGEGKVREFYGSPKVGFGGILGIFKPKNAPLTKTPVDSISNISKTLRRRNLLFGDISSVGSDIALGQKPNKNVYRNTAKDVIELAQMISEKQQNSAIAMATGGSVPSRSLTLASRGNVVDAVATVIQKSVDDRVNRAMADFRRPVGKEEMLEENQKKGSGGGGSGQGGGGYGGAIESISVSNFSTSDVDALGRMVAAEAMGETGLGKAGVLAVILNRYRLIKSGKAKPSDFGISGKNKNDVTLRDVIFAGGTGPSNQFSPIKDGRFDRISSSAGREALAGAIRAGGNDPDKFRQALISSGINSEDADYVVRSISFSNPKSRSSRPFNTREVTIGNHTFQQSPNVQLTGKIGKFDTEIKEIETMAAQLNSHEKAKYLIVMSGQKGYRQVRSGETIPTDYLHHGREDVRSGLYVRDYGITPAIHGGSQMLEGEGAPVVVPFGMRARAIVEGSHSIRFEDEKTKKTIARYHHMENIPRGINGKVLDGGTFIGSQGGRPGASSGYGGSTAVHTHLEGTLEWHRAFINTYSRGLDVTKTNLPQRDPKKLLKSKGQYDIIIPLDHVPPELANKIPDKRGGNTFRNARQTGADGRERQYTGDIARHVSGNLQRQGYSVRIVTPEEFGNYEDYDKFIEHQSKRGTTVLPFHLDAAPNRGGTGFLVRIRKNDTLDRNLAENLAPILQRYTNIFGGGQRYGGIDTVMNATINRAASGPAALLELGSLETLEKLFGKNFVNSSQYRKFLDELSGGIVRSVSIKTPKVSNKVTQTSTQKNQKITGFKKGGSVGNISNYASYENTGGSVVIAIQPMIIQKETLVDHNIPVSFPVPSRVNNNTNYRA